MLKEYSVNADIHEDTPMTPKYTNGKLKWQYNNNWWRCRLQQQLVTDGAGASGCLASQWGRWCTHHRLCQSEGVVLTTDDEASSGEFARLVGHTGR
jgi:hypothetical protein